MNCKNCGSEIQEGMKFCNNCGAPVEAPAQPTEQPAYTQPVYTQPVAAPAAAPSGVTASNVLTWGILGLAFAAATGILGIIFSIIGKKKAKQYQADGNELTGPAKVGSILANIGLPVGIAMTVLYTFSFIGGFIAGMMETLA